MHLPDPPTPSPDDPPSPEAPPSREQVILTEALRRRALCEGEPRVLD